MGLISGLLTLPLAPVRGVAWVAEVVAEEAERELAERNAPARRLEELEIRRASGEVDAEEAEALEAEIIDELLAGGADPLAGGEV